MKKIRSGKFLLTIITSLGLISSLFFPSFAFAFSGYGLGTSHNPYFISSCQQLQEMDQDLAGYYILVSNIDCTGIGFASIATVSSFSGTLDGQNHTILNLDVVTYGSMIARANGATIKNINLKGGTSTCVSYCGGMIGDVTDSTLSNLHSSMTVSGGGVYSGGLVGSMRGSTSLSQSSFSGVFTGDSYSAGLVGAMWDAGTSVNDSFVTGTIHAVQPYVGTIVGGFFKGTINNTFSSATLDAGENYYDAGLVGDSQGTINNSFSATSINNQGGYDNGLVGIDPSGTYSNNFIDAESNNTTNCGNNSGECTVVNNGNSDPGYFKNNTSNGPFSSWDFNAIWQQTSSYPILRNEADFVDPAVPNNGDANNDGMQDSYQANVISQVDPTTGKYVVLESSCAVSYNVQVGGEASGNGKDITYDYPAGLIGFTTFCAPGTTATITEYFYGSFDVSKLVMRNWDGANTYTTIPGATLSNITIAGQPVLKVVYQVTDGGALDNFQPANGVIRMISGPGVSAILPPNTGTGTIQINSAQTLLEYFSAALLMFIVAKMIRRYTK